MPDIGGGHANHKAACVRALFSLTKSMADDAMIDFLTRVSSLKVLSATFSLNVRGWKPSFCTTASIQEVNAHVRHHSKQKESSHEKTAEQRGLPSCTVPA